MQLSVFFSLLEKINNPIGWIFVCILFLIPLMISVFRSLLSFHNEHIRYFKANNFELTLSKLRENSIEYNLLEECKVEEYVYINTKLSLSILERTIIFDWIKNKPVTIGLIRKSWPQITFENGTLVPKLTKFEIFFMWYSLITVVLLIIFSTYVLILSIHSTIMQNSYSSILLPIFFYFMAFIVFKQSEPLLYTRRLIKRLK